MKNPRGQFDRAAREVLENGIKVEARMGTDLSKTL